MNNDVFFDADSEQEQLEFEQRMREEEALLEGANSTPFGRFFEQGDYGINSEAFEMLHAGLGAITAIQSYVSPMLTPNLFEEDGRLSPEGLSVAFLALQVELAELVQELDWKPWKKHSPANVEAIAEEFADVLAFMGLIMLHLEAAYGLDGSFLADAYLKKSVKNVDRANGRSGEEGYGLR